MIFQLIPYTMGLRMFGMEPQRIFLRHLESEWKIRESVRPIPYMPAQDCVQFPVPLPLK